MSEGEKLVLGEAALGEGKSRAVRVDYARPLQLIAADLIAAGMKDSRFPECTLKSWISKGREGGELPPLDDLPKMAAWWRRMNAKRVIKRRVPDFLARLECGSGGIPEVPALLPAAPPASGEPGRTAVAPGQEIEEQATEATLRQLYSFAAGFQEEMEAARKAESDTRFWNAFDRYTKITEKIRQWEQSSIAIRKARGDVVEVRAEMESLAQVFGVTVQSFTNVLLKLARQLAPGLPEPEIRDLVFPLRDKCFEHLKATRYAAVFDPQTKVA